MARKKPACKVKEYELPDKNQVAVLGARVNGLYKVSNRGTTDTPGLAVETLTLKDEADQITWRFALYKDWEGADPATTEKANLLFHAFLQVSERLSEADQAYSQFKMRLGQAAVAVSRAADLMEFLSTVNKNP